MCDREKPERLLPRREIVDRTGLSYPTIWRLIQRGDFPKGVMISPGRTAWSERAVEAWIKKKLKQ